MGYSDNCSSQPHKVSRKSLVNSSRNPVLGRTDRQTNTTAKYCLYFTSIVEGITFNQPLTIIGYTVYTSSQLNVLTCYVLTY